MMDSCYMNPHGTSSFLSPWNLARQEENAAALPDSSLKKTPPSLPIALIWNSVISLKSQVDNSGEGFGSTYPAFCTWQLQSFDVFPAIQQHADDDDHKSISFPPSKAVFSSDKGLWHLLPDSLSTWILGISWVPVVTASFKVFLLRKGWSSSSPK